MDINKILQGSIEVISNEDQSIDGVGQSPTRNPTPNPDERINEFISKMNSKKMGGGPSPSQQRPQPQGQQQHPQQRPQPQQSQPQQRPQPQHSQQPQHQQPQQQQGHQQQQGQHQQQQQQQQGQQPQDMPVYDMDTGQHQPYPQQQSTGLWKVIALVVLLGVVGTGYLITTKLKANKRYQLSKRLGGSTTVVDMGRGDDSSQYENYEEDSYSTGTVIEDTELEDELKNNLILPKDKTTIAKSSVVSEIVPYKKWVKQNSNMYMGYIEVESFEYGDFFLMPVRIEDFKELKSAGVVKVDFHVTKVNRKPVVTFAELNPSWKELQ